MFQEATLNIKNKASRDPLVAEFVSAECQALFGENFGLLGGIFHFNGSGDTQVGHKMNKIDVIAVLRAAEIIIDEPVEEDPTAAATKGKKKEENKDEADIPSLPPFYEEHAYEAMMGLDLIESGEVDDCLLYPDFLEALLRVAACYPFNHIEGADFPNLESKLLYIIDKLKNCYPDIDLKFTEYQKAR